LLKNLLNEKDHSRLMIQTAMARFSIVKLIHAAISMHCSVGSLTRKPLRSFHFSKSSDLCIITLTGLPRENSPVTYSAGFLTYSGGTVWDFHPASFL
jgi:hypothetical protein